RLEAGQTASLSITAPQIYDVTWRSTNSAVAMVDGSGLVGALKAGTAQIIAEDKLRGKSDICSVMVTEPEEPQQTYTLQLSATNLFLNKGEWAQLEATVSPATSELPAVVWASSLSGIADVTATGKVIALATGKTVVTATFADTLQVHCTVTVRETAAKVEVEELNPGSVELTFPNVDSASFYMLHLYQRNSSGRVPVFSLQINPNAQLTIGLRSENNKTSVTLNGLNVESSYEADIEVLQEINGKAEVISTLYTTFGAEDPTSNLDLKAKQPRAYYANGSLHLADLEGYTVTIYTISGQVINALKVSDTHEQHPIPLAKGIYIVSAQKEDSRQVFKIVVR
ncbi:MAG: Ig-like domain-containing protein, partial [Massilibacteroides sp.]|nr:Ig-like domain-containing protein [Massilibacteroides sp.]